MSTTTMKIALFGSTGNVGKDLITALKEQLKEKENGDGGTSFRFLIFTRDVAKATPIAIDDDSFELLVLPQKQKESGGEEEGENETELDALALAKALEGVETCLICVPQTAVHKCKEYVQELLPAFVEAKVKRVVKVGTGKAAEYEYGRCHQLAEDAIRESGLGLTVVEGGDYSTNPHWLGPGPPGAPYVLIDVFKGLSYFGGMFRSMGNVGSFFGPTVKSPFMDLRDFGHALASCLLDAKKHEGQTYRVYSEAVSMTDVANIYGELLGRTITVVDMSADEIHGILAMEKWEPKLIDLCIEMFDQFRKGIYEPDDSWDGLAKLCPGRTPCTFREFAEGKVNSRFKPLRLWW